MKLGNCFENSCNSFMYFPAMTGIMTNISNLRLVHGEVTGTGGDTDGIRYCHAWVEFKMNDGSEFCFDAESGSIVVKSTFYTVGSVSYTREYTKGEVYKMMNRFGHYGPWEKRLIEAEKGINPTFGHAKKGVHYE